MEHVWHKHQLRVRYQETDQMGVVYHANYLNWFEIGRTEMIRNMGMSYKELESRGLLLPLTEADVKFRMPAKYDDQVTIYTRIQEFSNLRLHFESEIRRNVQSSSDLSNKAAQIQPEGELLVSGITRHVWLNASWKAVRIDRAAPDLYQLLKGE